VVPVDNLAENPELIGKYGGNEKQEQPPEPALEKHSYYSHCCFQAAQLRRPLRRMTLSLIRLPIYGLAGLDLNISMTGSVSGRIPRQRKKDSAACSTSMPMPSASRPAPCCCANCRKEVSPLPYIIS